MLREIDARAKTRSVTNWAAAQRRRFDHRRELQQRLSEFSRLFSSQFDGVTVCRCRNPERPAAHLRSISSAVRRVDRRLRGRNVRRHVHAPVIEFSRPGGKNAVPARRGTHRKESGPSTCALACSARADSGTFRSCARYARRHLGQVLRFPGFACFSGGTVGTGRCGVALAVVATCCAASERATRSSIALRRARGTALRRRVADVTDGGG